MKVKYRKADIFEQFEHARNQAELDGKQIGEFVITEAEFEEFISLGNEQSDHLFAGYIVRHFKGKPSEYEYKGIAVTVDKK